MQAIAHFVTRYPWPVLVAWLVIAALAAPFASRAPAAMTPNPGSLKDAESTHVSRILEERFGERDNSPILLVTHSTHPASDARFQAAYERLMTRLQALPGVKRTTRYDAPNVYGTVSEDRRTTLSVLQIHVEDKSTLRAIRDLTSREQGDLTVRVTGGQPIAEDFTTFAEHDTKRSELAALPLTALVLFIVFGALVATGLPLLTGLLSITVALAGVYGLTQVTEVSTFAQSVITMLGLGAGIDYALLMVNRFREELARPELQTLRHPAAEAARRTILTAGRSVVFSGLTVAIAMAALVIPPLAFVRGMGMGGVLVVLLTVATSITALPAVLALLGERVNAPRLLRVTWTQNTAASHVWSTLARRVITRPWLAVLTSSAFLILLALPALDMRLGYAGARGLTPGVESRDALEDVEKLGAGGLLSSFEVILDLQGRPYDAETRARFRDTVRELEALPGVQAVISPFARSGQATNGGTLEDLVTITNRTVSRDRRYLRVTVLPERALHAEDIDAFTARLRRSLDRQNVPYLLGGAPVGQREFTRALVNATPLAVAAVFAGTFLLLAFAFRSIVIPLKSILMNTLTVGAAYGIVTLVVQQGFLGSLIGIPHDVGVLDSSLPLILFAVLFGLSMDYEIFLLSRVQEEHLRGLSNDEAVVQAVGYTGRIITSAALIMFIVFCAFIGGRVVASKSIGLGLAVAVALDATLVRLVLVPGFLKLAGRWNWWLPAWLDRRLPHIRLEH